MLKDLSRDPSLCTTASQQPLDTMSQPPLWLASFEERLFRKLDTAKSDFTQQSPAVEPEAADVQVQLQEVINSRLKWVSCRQLLYADREAFMGRLSRSQLAAPQVCQSEPSVGTVPPKAATPSEQDPGYADTPRPPAPARLLSRQL